MTDCLDCLRYSAIVKPFKESSVARIGFIDQPTTARKCRSNTTQIQPALIGADIGNVGYLFLVAGMNSAPEWVECSNASIVARRASGNSLATPSSADAQSLDMR
jgi:hypothetical protein